MFLKSAAVALTALLATSLNAKAETIPVLVPITGFLSLEGTSQRNGAVLAIERYGKDLDLDAEVTDTGTSPEGAVTALRRALEDEPSAAVASMLGTQMLAMLPIAGRAGVPLLTVSGTAKITELGIPWVFRFFPGDRVVKVAQARYAVEELGAKRPALLYQTTAYGQSGAEHLRRMQEANPDLILLHLHSGSTALVIRQARDQNIALPILAGSAMHQPTTAALLEPKQLAGVCAESASSPISEPEGPVEDFTAEYRARFGTEPDAFALAQYDGAAMMIAARNSGARTAKEVRDWLAGNSYDGLAMTYKSDGKGNMAVISVLSTIGVK